MTKYVKNLATEIKNIVQECSDNPKCKKDFAKGVITGLKVSENLSKQTARKLVSEECLQFILE